MTTPETSPAYGQLWKHKKNNREAYVVEVRMIYVVFRYSDTRRHCTWTLPDFKKQFYFSHVDA